MLAAAMRERMGTYAARDRKWVASGRVWPNGEFSVGYARVGEESTFEDEWGWTNRSRGLTPDELDERLAATLEYLEAVEGFYSMHAELAASGLTLSNVWNSHKPAPASKNGLKGMTGYGTKMLRSACYLLEDRLGHDDCVMVTLTVPTLGREARRKLALEWGRLTNRLVQWLSRELVKAGRTPAIVGCVEIQTGRLEKYRQGYLHLHLVCPAHANTGGTWAVDAKKLRAWWANSLERVIGCKLPNLPRIETALVEKSVEAYLGKYLSKGTGAELEQFIGDLGENAVPGQWWFMSAPMREAVRSGTKSGRNAGELLDALVNHLLSQGTGEGFEYVRHIDCMLDGKPVTVGWVGRLSRELADEVRAMLAVPEAECPF